MRLSLSLVSAAALWSLGTAAGAGVFPVADPEYTEVVSGRHVSSDVPSVPGWGVLPLSGSEMAGVHYVQSEGHGAVLAVGRSTSYFAQLPQGRSGADAIMQSGGSLTAPLKWVSLSGLSVAADSRVAVSASGDVVGVASPSGFSPLSCTLGNSTGSCSPGTQISASFGAVNSTSAAGAGSTVWVGAAGGLFRVDVAGSSASRVEALGSTPHGIWTVAASPDGSAVAAGNDTVLALVDASDLSILRWDWVTNVTDGQGGVYDDAVTALAWDPAGALWVGSPSVMDVRWANGSVSRIGPLQGLPWGNITSLAVTSATSLPTLTGRSDASTQEWTLVVGTTRGLTLARIEAQPPVPGGDGLPARPLPDQWNYFYEQRWLPGPSVLPVGLAVPSADAASTATLAVAVSAGEWGSGSGLAVLERQPWTLSQKAARMRNIQARHNRNGLVAECNLSPAGNLSSCSNYPSDNNGLWTSLVALSEVHRFVATGAEDAIQNARMWFHGMAILNNVTGIEGLMARSAVDPSFPRQTGSTWHNSTATGYSGWQWKGDTSSDEVAGHTYGWGGAIASLAGSTHPDAIALREEASWYISKIATYVVRNGFTLIDVTGRPTTWGHWDPHSLNTNQSWSDERGVNAMELLGLLSAGHDGAMVLANATAASVLDTAFHTVTKGPDGPDYLANLLNMKIESPSDDNYSDDELTYCGTWGALASAYMKANPEFTAAVRGGVWRTWDVVRPERPDWWNALSVAGLLATQPSASSSNLRGPATPLPLATASTTADLIRASSSPVSSSVSAPAFSTRTLSESDALAAVEDALWNLRTWPLELIEWSVHNSHRLDIRFMPGVNRDFQSHQDATRVLPANERAQTRWNSDPYTLDGGNGGNTEMDAGAWMAPWGVLVGYNLLSP